MSALRIRAAHPADALPIARVHVQAWHESYRGLIPDATIAALPRVDISYSHAGGDGVAVRAFVAAGARGIIAAGFAPGYCPPGEIEALAEAARQGIAVVQSTRAGSGRTFRGSKLRQGQ